jgi:hypothetical protein
MPCQGAITLSDLIDPTFTLVCIRCERRGVYGRQVNGHAWRRPGDRFEIIPPRRLPSAKRSIDIQCEAKFDPPPETRREPPTW